MPMLRITLAKPLDAQTGEALVTKASRILAEVLGKPEAYVMVVLDPPAALLFAGSAEPAAYLEVKSIGLPDSQTGPTAKALCALLEAVLGIPKSRVYIAFASAAPRMWGYNGGTF